MTDVLDPPSEALDAADRPAAEVPPAPRLARVLGAAGRTMIIAGIVVLLFVVFQLWGTDIQEARAQNGLESELDERFETIATEFDPALFARPVAEPVDPADDPVLADEPDGEVPAATADPVPTATVPEVDDELLALLFPDDGDALAKIEIPTIEVDKIVVRGVAVADLRKGPGHYDQTSLPGNPGNSSIAGHRTTYGSPFNRIDELQPGAEITVTSVQGEFTYRVMDPTLAYADDLDRVLEVGGGHIIVDPGATWVLGDFGDDRLTLTACHPKLSSRQRIIVTAELVDDAVALPEWAVAAEAERQAAIRLGADGTTDTVPPTTIADPTQTVTESPPPIDDESDDVEVAAVTFEEPDLDEGLSGERDAIPPAIAWLLAATALWFAGGWIGRRLDADRLQRLGLRFAGFVPAAVCLWFAFELVDRALPAG
ncbi:MAG: sortase [Actinomycetota bacterium]